MHGYGILALSLKIGQLDWTSRSGYRREL